MNSPGTLVALSLGGNVGNVKETFDSAIEQLKKFGLSDISRSAIYKTKPVGFDNAVPDFFNAVVTGLWDEDSSALHRVCKEVECLSGRPRKHEPWASRTLDLDIILYGNETILTPSLTVPHPEARKRFFVLAPLEEIAGNWKFPDNGEMVSDALLELTRSSATNEVLAKEPWQSVSEFKHRKIERRTSNAQHPMLNIRSS